MPTLAVDAAGRRERDGEVRPDTLRLTRRGDGVEREPWNTAPTCSTRRRSRGSSATLTCHSLKASSRSGSRPSRDLPLLTDEERRQICSWIGTRRDSRLPASIVSCTSCSSSRPRARPTRSPSSCGTTIADLRRVERARQPPGASLARPASARKSGRRLRRALGGDGGGAARRPQGGRRVCAARPLVPARAARRS